MRLLFNTTTEALLIPPEALVYIKADGNYSTLKVADGTDYVLTVQLGILEGRIGEMVTDSRFVRVGKSLIVNLDYVTQVSPSRQRIVLSDCFKFRYELTASKESLKDIKEMVERTGANQ